MKKIFSILIIAVFLMALPFAFADDNTTINTTVNDRISDNTEVPSASNIIAWNNTSAIDDIDAGSVPGDVMYGFDRAMERLSLALTFNKAKRSKKMLMQAEERLMELKELELESESEKLKERARENHQKALEKVKDEIEKFKNSGEGEKTKEDYKKLSNTQKILLTHAQRAEAIKNEILRKHAKNMTEEQVAHLEEVFDKIHQKNLEIEQKLDEKREAVKIRYKAWSKKADLDLEDEFADIDEQFGISKMRDRYKNQIKQGKEHENDNVMKMQFRAEERIAKAIEKAEELGISNETVKEYQNLMENAKKSLVEGDSDIAKEYFEQAKTIADEIQKSFEEHNGDFEKIRQENIEEATKRFESKNDMNERGVNLNDYKNRLNKRRDIIRDRLHNDSEDKEETAVKSLDKD